MRVGAAVVLAGALAGCAREPAQVPPGPVLCPVQDVPPPAAFIEPADPGDLRTYPEAMAANRERRESDARAVAAYNDARGRCGG